ncbi:hypothetical protein F5Y07DRAFT_385979 [Xylaria sp. FL0933]|nr:hypothetical protein F5Y07DRAFT_385979 [Xylaria sp. FL0933]
MHRWFTETPQKPRARPLPASRNHKESDATKKYDEGRVVVPPALATQDRWASIRRNAAERAAARQSDEQSRAECSGTTDNKDGETDGEEYTVNNHVTVGREYSPPMVQTPPARDSDPEWLLKSRKSKIMLLKLFKKLNNPSARNSWLPNANVRAPRPHLPSNIGGGLPSQEWHIQGAANGCAINALADTGANINAISKDDADRIGISPEPGTAGKTIRLPSGKTCLSLGTTNFSFNFDGEQTVHFIRCNIVERLEYSMILCYDFLRKTETLTRFFKTRIKEVARSSLRGFSLCLLDDHAACDGVKARMDGFINGTRARVVPDTGSGIMAVSASYARRLGLKVDTNRRTRVTFADGSSATTSGIVKAAWTFLPPDSQSELRPCLDDGGKVMSTDGKKRLVGSDTEKDDDSQNDDTWDYEWEYEWHVIDDLPVDAILSLDFIKQHDVFNRHEHAFVLIPPRSTLAELFGICELLGGNEGLRNLAEEFLADLASPDPFTYNMVVRESARRSEIQRKIRDLPLDAQAIQLIIERKRIDSWTRIHNARVDGNDWPRLRDEYLLSLRSQPNELILPQHSTTPTKAALESRPTRLRGIWRWRSRIP